LEVKNDIEKKTKIKIALDILSKNLTGTKVQVKCKQTENDKISKVLIIVKWGGILTEKGKNQCKRYATKFKKVYRGLDDYSVLSRKSRVYASDEMRVKQSAKIFVDTLVGKKNKLQIRSDEKVEVLLNHASDADLLREKAKQKIHDLFNNPETATEILSEEKTKPVFGNNVPWIRRSYRRLDDPKQRLVQILESLKQVIKKIENASNVKNSENYEKNGESILSILKR
ncbi:inositol hexakisphosphate and diphosphoinositol-pentakisphosphate kinase, partial [Bonamia ostreae]